MPGAGLGAPVGTDAAQRGKAHCGHCTSAGTLKQIRHATANGTEAVLSSACWSSRGFARSIVKKSRYEPGDRAGAAEIVYFLEPSGPKRNDCEIVATIGS